MRILFNFLALCIGFLMVLGTVTLVTVIGAELLHMGSHEIEARIILFSCVMLGFLFFAWIGSRFFRSVVPPTSTNSPEGSRDLDETRIMQEIYHGLSQMEKRVESLETLLIEKHREVPF